MSKGRRRRGGRGWLGYVLSFLLGSLLVLGGYFYLFPNKPFPPEAVDQKAITQKIFVIDQIISSQLYELGLSRKNVLLQQSSEKKERTLAWKQSLLKIQCPRSQSFPVIEGNFRKSIAVLGNPFSVQSTVTSESLQLDIHIFDRMTHRLTFIPAQIPSPKPGIPPGEPVSPKTGLPPRIAIVIDDLGGEDQIAQELLQWSLPITFSILPFTPHAKRLASEAHQRGKEIILHIPMEPHGYPKTRPGKGVLLHDMNKEKLRRQLMEDIEAVPYIQGVSNHMGSRLMEDPGMLKIILSELKKQDLFFLDSRTTSQTVGLQTARSLGVKSGERSVFLDHSQGEEAVKQSLEQLTQVALSTGKAIGIGHPHAATIKSLKEMIPKIQEKGIEIVPLSTLLE
jgi:polysaccharide deacetylase 2 family uncharacterized protein YibQ